MAMRGMLQYSWSHLLVSSGTRTPQLTAVRVPRNIISRSRMSAKEN